MGDEIGSVTDAQASALREQIQMAVARKQLDASKAQGGAIVELLQAAVRIGKATGKGDQFDANA